MKRAVVTGGAGFIGSNMVDKLIKEGIEVIVLDNFSTGKKENCNSKAIVYNVDISTDPLESFLENVDVVFHFAASARVQPSIEDPISFNKNNVDGTLRLLLSCYKMGVKRVIYSASSSAYGNTKIMPISENSKVNPISPYGLQKLIGEQYCKLFSEVYNLDTVSLRYFNVYGERMSLEGAYCLVMGIFANQTLQGKPLTITNDGNQRRDFTYVQDIVEANWLAANYSNKLNGEVFNIGSGKNYSVNEIADMFGGDKVYGKKVLEPFETLADNSKAKNILGWEPKGNLPLWVQKYKNNLIKVN